MGLFTALGSLFGGTVLGKAAGGALVDLGVNQLGKSLDKRRMDKMGLTPQEQVGAMGGPGQQSGVGNMLGNNQSAVDLQRKQHAQESAQRDKDRLVALNGQASSLAGAQAMANASIHSANTAAAASTSNAQLNAETARAGQGIQAQANQMLHNREVQRMFNDWANNNPKLNLMMKELGMGPDNINTFLHMTKYGLNLNSIANMDPKEFETRMGQMMAEMSWRGGRPWEAAGGLLGNTTGILNRAISPYSPIPAQGPPGIPPMPVPPTLGNNPPTFDPNPSKQ